MTCIAEGDELTSYVKILFYYFICLASTLGPFQVRCKSVVNPFQVRSYNYRINGGMRRIIGGRVSMKNIINWIFTERKDAKSQSVCLTTESTKGTEFFIR